VESGFTTNLRAIDASWPPLRDAGDLHHAWRWEEISAPMRETFVVLLDEDPIGVWCSKVGSPLDLATGRFYRLDFVELKPSLRGDGSTSAMVFGLIAERAVEHGAGGVVLSAFRVDKLVAAYRRLGAVEGAPPGWNYPNLLVPLTFDHAAVQLLRERIHDIEEEPSTIR